MVGNLVVSCLLAASVASPKPLNNSGNVPLDHTAVVRDSGDYRANVASGYCLRYYDEMNRPYFTTDLFNYDVSLEITLNEYDYSPIYATNFNSSDIAMYHTEGDLMQCTYFNLYYSYSNDYIRLAYDVRTYFLDSFGSHTEYSFAYDIQIGQSLQDMCDYFESYFPLQLGVYFIDPIVLSADQTKLFNTVFTSNVNTNYFTYYNGWFHFTPYYNTSDNEVIYLSLPGYFIYQEVKANYLWFTYLYTVANRSYTIGITDFRRDYARFDYTIFGSGINVGILDLENVYFGNVFMPMSTYAKLDDFGDFQYLTPNHSDSSWFDLFANIADTPIIFLTSMFSFDLLGVPFYSAFFGIITAIAMFFILKKVL